jgi:hypothetical protein
MIRDMDSLEEKFVSEVLAVSKVIIKTTKLLKKLLTKMDGF